MYMHGYTTSNKWIQVLTEIVNLFIFMLVGAMAFSTSC